MAHSRESGCRGNPLGSTGGSVRNPGPVATLMLMLRPVAKARMSSRCGSEIWYFSQFTLSHRCLWQGQRCLPPALWKNL
eukprot:5230002-Amphidinium_carterae.1